MTYGVIESGATGGKVGDLLQQELPEQRVHLRPSVERDKAEFSGFRYRLRLIVCFLFIDGGEMRQESHFQESRLEFRSRSLKQLLCEVVMQCTGQRADRGGLH